jgi:hypothetical protein
VKAAQGTRCSVQSTDVRNPFLGFDFSRRNRLRRKLEHSCFLTFNQLSQQHHLPVWKFQRIMMSVCFVLVDLPKDGRQVIEHLPLPPSIAPYRTGEGKLRSGKNANRRVGIFRGSKPDCTGIEVLRSQFFANFGWP